MKNTRTYIIVAMLVIGMPLAYGHVDAATTVALAAKAKAKTTSSVTKPAVTIDAKATATTDTTTKDAATSATSTPSDAPAPESLSDRKANAEKGLRTLQTQFTTFATRTQSTIDRLTVKGIDTTKAQAELTLTNTALGLAKTNLDLFAAIVIPDTTPDQKTEPDTSELKASLKKIEENLKDARTHLIQSLADLKALVATSIDAQVQ